MRSKRLRFNADGALVAGVLGLALALRSWAWVRFHGPLTGGDSTRYLGLASAIARGDVHELSQWPLHALYAFALVPMYSAGLPEAGYILTLHLLLSILTVVFLMLAGRRLASPKHGLIVGLAAAVNPGFLLWLPYVLTETFFFCCLAIYAYVTILLLQRPSVLRAAAYAVTTVVLIFGRPVALPLVCPTTLIVLVAGLDGLTERHSRMRRRLVAATAGAGALLVGLVVLVALGPRLLALPTVTQSFWASTELKVGNMDDARDIERRDIEIDRMFADRPVSEKNRYKLDTAAKFVADHPWLYVGRAARKFVSFWYPWIFATTWSPQHRLLDAAISLALTLGAGFALRSRELNRVIVGTLLMMAVLLGVLSAFSHIDPDGRYRVPGEVLLLIVAPVGWLGWTRAIRPRRFEETLRQHDASRDQRSST